MTPPYDFTTGAGYVDARNALKIWENTFTLSPEQWRTAKSTFALDWQWVQFEKDKATEVPTERGLYAFIVEHCDAYFPPHGYIMYVGITGDTSSARNLRVRFKDYLREKDKGGRSKVVVMLNMFKDDLYFHFAAVPDTSLSLEEIETEMLTALLPPCNEAFDAEIRPAVKALR